MVYRKACSSKTAKAVSEEIQDILSGQKCEWPPKPQEVLVEKNLYSSGESGTVQLPHVKMSKYLIIQTFAKTLNPQFQILNPVIKSLTCYTTNIFYILYTNIF